MSDIPTDPPADPPADLSAEALAKAGPPVPEEPLYPWDSPEEAGDTVDPSAPRERHDAFNESRKRTFLRALVKCGCLLDACRAAGAAPRTVYRHQEKDPVFAEHCRLARAMAATPLELTAFQRAVEGVEEPFACGGEVHVRRRYDSGLLRLLLQGANPKKYGRNPGFTRKRVLKFERKAIEREIRAEIAARRPSFDESMEMLERELDAFDMEGDPRRLAEGWTRTADGEWVPPGYGPIPGWTPPEPTQAGDSATPEAPGAYPSDPP